jgi:uncharacterized protein (DUF2236 family)
MSAVDDNARTVSGAAKQALARQIRGMTGSSTTAPLAYLQPAGDPGLFGPQSVTWKVHAHFVSMLTGGLSSLLIQALHPGALAGVWDHSSFRTDLRARLGRTAHFIAATTFGGQDMAQQAIQTVNRIHTRVKGVRPDGVPYDARDPHLLRWVHLGEVLSFVRAYVTYADPSLPIFAQNRYIEEMRQIGLALGASDLPGSVSEAHDMLQAYQKELVFDERVREVLRLIENFPSRKRDRWFVDLIIEGAFDLLPDWVLQKLQKPRRAPWRRKLTQQALSIVSIPVDWTLATEGVSAYARRRLQPA